MNCTGVKVVNVGSRIRLQRGVGGGRCPGGGFERGGRGIGLDGAGGVCGQDLEEPVEKHARAETV